MIPSIATIPKQVNSPSGNFDSAKKKHVPFNKRPLAEREKIVEELKQKWLPKLQAEAVTQKKILENYGISRTLLYSIKDKLEKNEDPLQRKVSSKGPQKTTDNEVKAVKDALFQIQDNELSIGEAIQQSKIPSPTFRKIAKTLADGKDPTKHNLPKKIDTALREKIKALIPQIKNGTKTKEQAAAECEIPLGQFKNNLKKIEKGDIQPNRLLKAKVADQETVDRVKAALERIKKKKLSKEEKEDLAKESKTTVPLLNLILTRINNNEDPTQHKRHQKVTAQKIAEIRELIPKIDKNELTIPKAASQLGMKVEVLKRKLKELKKTLC